MLEIILLIYLTRKIGAIVGAKGRKAGWYKFLTVLLWFGCEVIGAIIGAIIVGVSNGPQLLIYLFALCGAALGAVASFLVAKAVPPIAAMPAPPPPPTFG
jgi:zinc transporter ZupT